MPRSLVRVVVAASLALAAAAPAASAHQGNPNFRSYVDGVTPRVPGLSLQVLNFDDRLELTNRTGRTVVVQGYNDDPYIRILADGTVQVNRRSPAAYLNEDRTGAAPVPASADPKAAPLWRTVDRTGRFDWHDHRIHWMAKGLPPQVKDKGRKTKIWPWSVPVTVGGQAGAIHGTLFWQPRASGVPAGAIGGFAVLLVLAGAVVVVVRRRRGGSGGSGGRARTAGREAW
jgi:hypothetical protein